VIAGTREAPTTKQHGERHDRLPSLADDLGGVRQLFGRQPPQPGALGLEMDLHEHAEEMHQGRHDRGQDHRLIGDVQEFDHQEGGGAHDRRGDLPAGRRCRFHGRREVALIADADHRRDREGPDRDRVGDGGARNHAEQGRAEDRDLGRTARIAARHAGGEIDEELAETDPGRKHAEKHVVEDVSGNDSQSDAIDALAREVEMVDDVRPGSAGMLENARHGRAEMGIEHHADGDDRERPAHGTARRLEQNHDQDRPHEHIRR
jgi:hypothetical protein